MEKATYMDPGLTAESPHKRPYEDMADDEDLTPLDEALFPKPKHPERSKKQKTEEEAVEAKAPEQAGDTVPNRKPFDKSKEALRKTGCFNIPRAPPKDVTFERISFDQDELNRTKERLVELEGEIFEMSKDENHYWTVGICNYPEVKYSAFGQSLVDERAALQEKARLLYLNRPAPPDLDQVIPYNRPTSDPNNMNSLKQAITTTRVNIRGLEGDKNQYQPQFLTPVKKESRQLQEAREHLREMLKQVTALEDEAREEQRRQARKRAKEHKKLKYKVSVQKKERKRQLEESRAVSPEAGKQADMDPEVEERRKNRREDPCGSIEGYKIKRDIIKVNSDTKPGEAVEANPTRSTKKRESKTSVETTTSASTKPSLQTPPQKGEPGNKKNVAAQKKRKKKPQSSSTAASPTSSPADKRLKH